MMMSVAPVPRGEGGKGRRPAALVCTCCQCLQHVETQPISADKTSYSSLAALQQLGRCLSMLLKHISQQNTDNMYISHEGACIRSTSEWIFHD